MTPEIAKLLPPKRGAVARRVSMELGRELTIEDLKRLQIGEGDSASFCPNPIKHAREIHHRQAQLVAEGRKDIEIAAIVGCAAGRISALKKDPTFKYLVAYYREQATEIEFETHRRIQGKLVDVLELAVDEIQARLEDTAQLAATSLGDLRKVAEFAADRTIAPTRAVQQGPVLPPARIELNFGWTGRTEETEKVIDATKVIDTRVIDATPEE